MIELVNKKLKPKKINIKSYYTTHSRTEFEAVFKYPLFSQDGDLSKPRFFELECFIVFPLVVELDNDHYSHEEFYKDIKAMIRLRQPKLSFSELIGQSDYGPSQYIYNFINNNDGQNYSLEHAIDEAKLFGVSFFRHVYRVLRKYFPEGSPPNYIKTKKPELAFTKCIQTLEKGEIVLKQWVELCDYASKLEDIENQELYKTLVYVQEYCIYTFLDSLALFDYHISCWQNLSPAQKLMLEKIKKISSSWLEISKTRFNNPPDFSNYKETEKYSFRRRALKKKIQSVLYLNVRTKPFFEIRKQFGAMIAAGVAAAWALSLEIYILLKTGFGGFTRQEFGMSGLILFSAFIFAYILKDRIKEVGRKKFRSGIWRKLPDHSNKVFYKTSSGTDLEVGKANETMDYIKFSSLSEKYQELINSKRIFTVEPNLNLIRYHKTFEISAKALNAYDEKLTSAHDILRYNITRFFTFFDDPVEIREGFMLNNSSDLVKLPKSYYFDMIFNYKVFEGHKKVKILEQKDIVRVVANKRGIVRLEKMKS